MRGLGRKMYVSQISIGAWSGLIYIHVGFLYLYKETILTNPKRVGVQVGFT